MLVAYTLEILPYKIRAKGFAVMVITVRIISPFCAQSVPESHGLPDFRLQSVCKSMGHFRHRLVLLSGVLGLAGDRASLYLLLCCGDKRFVIRLATSNLL
jgi:hypothetical protein